MIARALAIAAALAACGKDAGQAAAAQKDSARARAVRTEAEVAVAQIATHLEAYRAEHGAYPLATAAAGPTPPVGACCAKPGGTCAPDPALWTGAWQDLGFSMDSPFRYSYWIEPKGADALVVHAIGDLDCNGVTSDYRVRLGPDGRTATWTRGDE